VRAVPLQTIALHELPSSSGSPLPLPSARGCKTSPAPASFSSKDARPERGARRTGRSARIQPGPVAPILSDAERTALGSPAQDDVDLTPPERLEKCQAVTPPSYEVKPPHLRGFHGASGTRTRALLGAISALFWPEFSLTSGFPSVRVSSPNTFPNTLQPVLQWDNAHHWGARRATGRRGGRPERRPVTPEVAGSSPVAPASGSACKRASSVASADGIRGSRRRRLLPDGILRSELTRRK
jgi:hypothetical protein